MVSKTLFLALSVLLLGSAAFAQRGTLSADLKNDSECRRHRLPACHLPACRPAGVGRPAACLPTCLAWVPA